MSVNRIDATLTDEQRNRANAALEYSLDDLGRRFARKSNKAAPSA